QMPPRRLKGPRLARVSGSASCSVKTSSGKVMLALRGQSRLISPQPSHCDLLGCSSPIRPLLRLLAVATTSHYAPAAPAVWRRYLQLTKPKVVALITFTAIVGTLLASPGLPPAGALLWGNLGIALAAACAATLNHVLD